MDDIEITCDMGDVETAIEALVAYVGTPGALWEFARQFEPGAKIAAPVGSRGSMPARCKDATVHAPHEWSAPVSHYALLYHCTVTA